MSKTNTKYRNLHHVPVMLREVLEYLAPSDGESYLDVTAGMGGHATAVITATGVPRKAVLVDRDPQAVEVLKKRFAGADLKNQDFLSASNSLLEEGRRFDMILADLGVSSLHFDTPARGFSFNKPGPLDMRMDPRQPLSAAEIVNGWSETDLVRILKDFGEESRAVPIARAIITARPITDTAQLANAISGVKKRVGRIHPATKTFQALRVAVNDELEQLGYALPVWIDLLSENGRLVVISFQSLEDRLVKQAMFAHSKNPYEADLRILSKKPIVPSSSEIAINPRARSAKLRAAAKIKNKKG